MTAGPRRCYLHVGFQKTGTTYLQSIFWQSQQTLREQGLELLPSNRLDTSYLMLAVRGMLQDGLEPPAAWTVRERLTEQAAASTAERALISQESLAPCTPRQIRDLVGRLDGFEPHVVVTVRDVARQVPSMWQQRVKARSKESYESFLQAVVERSAAARSFWQIQDVPGVLERWAGVVGAARVHVVTVPPAGSSSTLLLERFCSLLEVDPESLDRDTHRANTSLGITQAELLRRVNLALGDRLPHPRAGYGPMGKRFLGESILATQRGTPPRLPPAMTDWCDRTADEWRKVIAAGGFHVVGDLDDLLPSPEAFVDTLADVTADDLVDSAASALADILHHRWEEQQEIGELRRRLIELETSQRNPFVRRAARAAVRRVRARIG